MDVRVHLRQKKKFLIQNPYTQERPIADKRLPVYLQDSWVSEHLADMWDSVSDPHLLCIMRIRIQVPTFFHLENTSQI